MKWLKHLIWKDITQDPNYEEVQVPCPEITIEQIDQPLYDKLLAEAKAAGATFGGSMASMDGLNFDWDYDEPSQTLHITCTRKPFYATCLEVESRIRELAAKAKGGI